MAIRNSAKAVIIENSKVLLTKNKDEDGYFYLFPGGGQEKGEVLPETLTRECIEEIGEYVEVKDLLHIREYVGKNHEYAHFDRHAHRIEYYFICHIVPSQNSPLVPSNPDSHQVGIEWVPVQDLLKYRLYPKAIRECIQDFERNKRNAVYLGDIN